MTEAELCQHLAPYAYDGTEAVEALIALMVSHSRPADPRRAIAKILERFRVDAVVSILDGGMS